MVPRHNGKWWVLSAAVLILVVSLMLAFAWFVHYVRDDSDLIKVDARAHQLGIPQLAASQGISPVRERQALVAAENDVNRLKDFELCNLLTMMQLWSFTNSRSAYQQNLPKLQALVDSWGESRCASCETDIDGIADHPIILGDNPSDGMIKRQDVVEFLAARLLTAHRQQVPECELRLVRYLASLDPDSMCQIPWHGLPFLTCRLDEIDSHREEISGILQWLAADLPGSMRNHLAVSYVQLMAAARQGGSSGMRTLGVFPGWLDGSMPVSSWEVRHWRAPVLQHWIDTFSSLDCAAASAAIAQATPAASPSPFALGRSASDLRSYQLFSQRACLALVMIQAIQARLDSKPMPHDPFAPAGQALRSVSVGEKALYYSIGRDGVDQGGQQGDLPILTIWTPPISTPGVH